MFRSAQENRLEIIRNVCPEAAAYISAHPSDDWYELSMDEIKALESIITDKSLIEIILNQHPGASISQLLNYRNDIINTEYPKTDAYIKSKPNDNYISLEKIIALDHVLTKQALTEIIFTYYPQVTTTELIDLGQKRDAYGNLATGTAAYNLDNYKFRNAVLASHYNWNEFVEVITTFTSTASRISEYLKGHIGALFNANHISLKDIMALAKEEAAILSNKTIASLILQGKLTTNEAIELTKAGFANLTNAAIATLVVANKISALDAANLNSKQAKFLSQAQVVQMIATNTHSIATMFEVYDRTVATCEFENAHIEFALSEDILPLALNNEIKSHEFDLLATRYFRESVAIVAGEMVTIDRYAEMKASLATIQLKNHFINVCNQNNILEVGRDAVLAVTDQETFLQHIVVPGSAEATLQNVQAIQHCVNHKDIKAFFADNKDLLPVCFQHHLMTLPQVMSSSQEHKDYLRSVLSSPVLLKQAKELITNNQYSFKNNFEYRAPKLNDPRIQRVIEDLDRYTTRIEQLTRTTNDFGTGFTFFRRSRSKNREANYNLAKQIRLELSKYIGDNPAGEIERLFEQGNLLILRECKGVKNVIRSAELNRIIKSARDSIQPPAVPKPPRVVFGRKRRHDEI